MSYQQLFLGKANSFTTTFSPALYTKPGGTFTNTETSMYSEVISLASTTYYGGASLANQTERYLIAIVFANGGTADNGTSGQVSHYQSNNDTINSILSTYGSAYTFTPNHTSFGAAQSALENDGKHFIAGDDGSGNTMDILLVDKNTLGGGSSSSSSSSLTSWAYSSQSATDPNVLIDWTTATPDYSITADSTDWKTDLKAKITAKGLTATDLLLDWELEMNNQHRNLDPNNQNTINNFIEYINKKINTQ